VRYNPSKYWGMVGVCSKLIVQILKFELLSPKIVRETVELGSRILFAILIFKYV
jgi:hypothetical protein